MTAGLGCLPACQRLFPTISGHRVASPLGTQAEVNNKLDLKTEGSRPRSASPPPPKREAAAAAASAAPARPASTSPAKAKAAGAYQ